MVNRLHANSTYKEHEKELKIGLPFLDNYWSKDKLQNDLKQQKRALSNIKTLLNILELLSQDKVGYYIGEAGKCRET